MIRPVVIRFKILAATIFLVANFLAALVPLACGEDRTSIWTGNGGTNQWSLATNWDPTGVPFNDPNLNIYYHIEIHSGGVQISGINPTIDSLALSNQLTIGNGSLLTIFSSGDRPNSGMIVNSGQINLDSVGAAARLRISSGDVTLTGGGIIQLGNHAENRIGGINAGWLFNEDNLIRGSGQVGDGAIGIVNRGQIIANQSVAMTISPSSLGVINEGMIRATNGATLNLSHPISAIFDNSLGNIEADHLSTINLSGVEIRGGNLSTFGSGIFRVTGATLLNAAWGMSLDGRMEVTNGQTLFVTGNLQHSGNTIELQSSGGSTTLQVIDQTTLAGTGEVVLTHVNSTRIIGTGISPSLINHNTIRGTGILGNSTMQIVNHGVIQGEVASGLTVSPNTQGFLNADSGVLRATNNGLLTLTGGAFSVFFNNQGSIEVDSGSTLIATNSATLANNGGSIRVGSGATMQIAGALQNNAGVIELSNGNLILGQGLVSDAGTLSGSGTISGTVEFGANSRLSPGSSPGILEFSGFVGSAGTIELEIEGNLVDGSLPLMNIVNSGLNPLQTQMDQVHVLDQLSLLAGATIEVQLSSGGSFLSDGDFFDLLTADSLILSSQAGINLPQQAGFEFSYQVLTLFDPAFGRDRDVFRVSVTAVPEPNMFGLMLAASCCWLVRRNRRSAD